MKKRTRFLVRDWGPVSKCQGGDDKVWSLGEDLGGGQPLSHTPSRPLVRGRRIYTHTYIEREREGTRSLSVSLSLSRPLSIYTYIYIYMYVERARDRER